MHRHFEHYGNPMGWICYAFAASVGTVAKWLGDNAGLVSLAMSAGFGGIGVWFQWQTLKIRRESVAQRKGEKP